METHQHIIIFDSISNFPLLISFPSLRRRVEEHVRIDASRTNKTAVNERLSFARWARSNHSAYNGRM